MAHRSTKRFSSHLASVSVGPLAPAVAAAPGMGVGKGRHWPCAKRCRHPRAPPRGFVVSKPLTDMPGSVSRLGETRLLTSWRGTGFQSKPAS